MTSVKILKPAICCLLVLAFQSAADEPPRIIANFLIVGELNSKAKIEDGETACIVTNDEGSKWELVFGERSDLRKLAGELHGKKVVAQGGGGIKIRRSSRRYILKVDSLKLYVEKPYVNAFIGEDRKLKNTIQIKESHFDSKGSTGFLWTIETDGRWRRQPLKNDQLGDADQSGKLKSFDLIIIAVTFEQSKFLDLPKQLGEQPDNKSRRVKIAFGDKASQLTLPDDIELQQFNGGKDEENVRRFASILQVLKGATR